MSRNGTLLIGAVGLGALLTIGGQATFSQVATSQASPRQRVEYLCVDQRSDHWSMHGPGVNFDGGPGELARKLGIKLGESMQGDISNKLVADVLNKLAAESWELTATNATALQYTQQVTYIFRRGR